MRAHVKQVIEITIRRVEVTVIDGDTQNVLVQITDGELHGGIPLGVERVVHHASPVLLCAHAHFTIRVTLS